MQHTSPTQTPALSSDFLASLFSATNIGGLGGIFAAAAVGSALSVFIFATVIALGTWHKVRALREGYQPSDNIFLRPEVTATVFMIAALICMLEQLIIFAVGVLHLPNSTPYFSQMFSTPYAHLAAALGWAGGATADYFLKLSDRRLFDEQHSLSGTVISNPSLWYAVGNIAFSFSALYFGPQQSTIIITCTVASMTSSAAAIFYSSWLLIKKPAQHGFGINYLACAANLFMALQITMGPWAKEALFFMIGQLFFAAAHIRIIAELKKPAQPTLRTAQS